MLNGVHDELGLDEHSEIAPVGSHLVLMAERAVARASARHGFERWLGREAAHAMSTGSPEPLERAVAMTGGLDECVLSRGLWQDEYPPTPKSSMARRGGRSPKPPRDATTESVGSEAVDDTIVASTPKQRCRQKCTVTDQAQRTERSLRKLSEAEAKGHGLEVGLVHRDRGQKRSADVVESDGGDDGEELAVDETEKDRCRNCKLCTWISYVCFCT